MFKPMLNDKITDYMMQQFNRDVILTPITPMTVTRDVVKKGRVDYVTLPHGIPNFITAAKEADNIYNILKNRVTATKDYDVLMHVGSNVERIRATPNLKIVTDLLTYNLAMYDYVFMNFRYRITKFLQTKTGWDDTKAWDIVTEIIWNSVVKLSNRTGYSILQHVTDHNNLMLDFIAILKILDIYESNSNALIWMCAGSYHTGYVSNFVYALFSLFDESIIEQTINHKAPNAFDDLYEYGFANALVGGVNNYIAALRNKNKEEILTLLEGYLECCNVNESTINNTMQKIKNLDLSRFSLYALSLIIMKRRNYSIFGVDEIQNLLRMNNVYPLVTYLPNGLVCFIDEIRHIFIPKWEYSDINQLETYEIIDLINDSKSLSFADLQEGANILTLPTNTHRYSKTKGFAQNYSWHLKNMDSMSYSSDSEELDEFDEDRIQYDSDTEQIPIYRQKNKDYNMPNQEIKNLQIEDNLNADFSDYESDYDSSAVIKGGGITINTILLAIMILFVILILYFMYQIAVSITQKLTD
jgi:hypothetical protein